MNRLIKRALFADIAKHLHQKEVTVIVGTRQTGKTTLLNELRKYLSTSEKIKETSIKSFNLDLVSDLDSLKSQTDFIKFLKEELKKEKKIFVFIDEAQRLENPGRFIKGIYDLNLPMKFVLTGSSMLEIKSKFSEPLTGRKRVFHLLPLSFSEYLSYYDKHLLELIAQKDISSLNKKKIMDYLYSYLIFGGYPRLVFTRTNEERIKILNEIYSSYIEKDIVGFMKVKNLLSFAKFVSLLAHQIGNLINLKEISNTLGIEYRTILNYLSASENTFVIKTVRPYYSNPRKELTKMPKIYFIDNGLRNLAIKSFVNFEDNRDKGYLLENFVSSCLLRISLLEINYWRTKDKKEVDFVIKDFYGNSIPIEVKAVLIKQIEIPRNLRSFIEIYKPKKAVLVNLNKEDIIKIGKTEVYFVLPFSLEKMNFGT